MAAAMRNLRSERFCRFLRLFVESGGSFSRLCVVRKGFSISGCKLYAKTLPLLAKKRDALGRTDHDFARPRKFGRQDRGTRNPSREEDHSESDSESEDEGNKGRQTNILKQKTGKMASFSKLKLNQKSDSTKTLRPSKYLYRDRSGWNQEQKWEGREIPEDLKGKTGWYARQMTRLTHEGKIDEALELFSFVKEEKLSLTVEIFNITISAYAKSGRMRKAFKLYNDLKKRALQATPHTYTSLFNVCTKSSSSQHALENVEKLLAEINTRIDRDDLEMNVITYNAAIQAVTICGDPYQAFEIYKEMKHNNIKPDGHTFSSLLNACAFDKVEGPSTALELLQEMKSLKIKPDIYIFNSVLKVMREFKVFNQEHMPELRHEYVQDSRDTVSQSVERKSSEDDLKQSYDEELKVVGITQDALNSSLKDDIVTRNQSTEDLKLHSYFPGVEKFIQMMAIEDVYPDIRTFQLLLYLTSSKAEGDYLMDLMKSCNISPDVTFYNTLVRRNVLEGDLRKAKQHMKTLEETLKVSPSEKSYQVLARGCTSPDQGLALLEEIRSTGTTPGQSVYGTLIAGAAKKRQFTYMIKLVKSMTSDGVKPNDRIITVLERAYNLPCKKPFIKEKERHRSVKEKRFRHVEQKGFQAFFETWKEKALKKETTSEDNACDDEEDDDDDEDSEFSHL